MGKFTFGKVSMAQLDTVHPLLKELAISAIEKSTVDFGILPLGGKRTKTEQKKLFDEKYSKCDGTIKKSYHQSGNALDFVAYVDDQYTWSNKEAFQAIHLAVMEAWLDMHNKEYNLVWGGDWLNAWDRPHYELRKK
jgi:peptidoglycan L-alanyl-D-glutamate endopeptidase CwlK